MPTECQFPFAFTFSELTFMNAIHELAQLLISVWNEKVRGCMVRPINSILMFREGTARPINFNMVVSFLVQFLFLGPFSLIPYFSEFLYFPRSLHLPGTLYFLLYLNSPRFIVFSIFSICSYKHD
jgi:hypothetical protein